MQPQICWLLLVQLTCLLDTAQGTENGDVRLEDGGFYYGRVEIFYNSKWYTVCKDEWDLNDAAVVCRQLSLGPPVAVFPAIQGTRINVLFGFACSGLEQRLDDCGNNESFKNRCSQGHAGVNCSKQEYDVTTQLYLDDGSIRLVDGSSLNEGRVEVYWNGQWGTICDNSWENTDADVVCRQLGYTSALVAVGNAYFGEGSGDILLDYVRCLGHERNLLKCAISTSSQNGCSHSNDVGVVCNIEIESSIFFREGSVRLSGSSRENVGRVEIYHAGSWGTVCDDNWGSNDADVVCKQLGYPDGAHLVHDQGQRTYNSGQGDILLDEVSCEGSERYVTDCQHNGWYEHNCGHIEDAGVTCFMPERYQPRLVNGSTWYEGRVEIWNVDHWEGVCSYKFGVTEARVVCKKLGFSDVHTVEDYEKFGNSFAVPASIYFTCSDSNPDLASCSKPQLVDTYCKATAISCVQDEPLEEITLAGIGFVAFCAALIFLATVVHIYVKMTGKNPRSTPGSTTVSVRENVQEHQSPPRIEHDWQAPPSYNDVLSDPFYYPNVRTISQPNVSQRPLTDGSRTL